MAFTLYDRAARQGHERAMNLLARCYEEGWGVAADPATARAWYRRSAEGGYFRGQYNYASLLLADGRAGEAMAWFERAMAGAPAASRRSMARALIASAAPPLRALGEHALVVGQEGPLSA